MNANFHESFSSTETNEGPTNRSFGLTVGGILLAIVVVRVGFSLKFDLLSIILAAIGSVLVVLAVFAPGRLEIANRLWMRLGMLLARIVTPVILFLIYVVGFVPIGMLMRLRGHDPLRAKKVPEGGSYWINRPSPDELVDGMPRQF